MLAARALGSPGPRPTCYRPYVFAKNRLEDTTRETGQARLPESQGHGDADGRDGPQRERPRKPLSASLRVSETQVDETRQRGHPRGPTSHRHATWSGDQTCSRERADRKKGQENKNKTNKKKRRRRSRRRGKREDCNQKQQQHPPPSTEEEGEATSAAAAHTPTPRPPPAGSMSSDGRLALLDSPRSLQIVDDRTSSDRRPPFSAETYPER
ncbi:unnamed protein product [Pleuronectes platessa]|uniref:Uncharacterized protein n=1 Tax=Pleuronectes platessa TaxID=8262 RepID=A0A9N7VPY0_PLEPL|nr:unnamed protein product [Pleuronectes platessa]